ncbi:family 16 glycoside hydrolase [Paenibacillus agaridevorans]|uniref:family 16 glycoside hydrolase n=1 Tax=Paenibacillus agaridevorans TaxID=171404 RepID=UPI001BE45C1A|nr:family 16 glycoside hydrolase [Paenibacillus agaridevorans]
MNIKTICLTGFLLVMAGFIFSSHASAHSLYQNDFNDGDVSEWLVQSGSWSADDGGYRQSGTAASGYRTTLTNKRYSDIELLFDYTIEDYAGDSANWAGVMLRKSDVADHYSDSGYMVYVRQSGQIHLYKAGVGNIASYQTGEAQSGQKSLRIVAQGSEISVYYNGGATPVISVTDTAYANGYVSLVTGKTQTRYDNIFVNSDYSSIEIVPASYHLNVNGVTSYRAIGHTGSAEDDIGESYYELLYDHTKLSIDPVSRTVKGLSEGAHSVTIVKNEHSHTVTFEVNDYNNAIMMKGDQVVYQNFEGSVPGEFTPDANFSIVSDNGNRVLAMNGTGAAIKTGVIPGNYHSSNYMIEADVKQMSGDASTNGGFGFGLRSMADGKNYRFRYLDILKYSGTSRKFDANSPAIRDRIGIARDEAAQLGTWYYGAMKTDAPLGMLNLSSRSFNQYYKMTAAAVGTATRKIDGTDMYPNLILQMHRLDGSPVGSVATTTTGADFNQNGLKMSSLINGRAFLGAENTLVYVDNVRITNLYPLQDIQLVIEDAWIEPGQSSKFIVKALPSGDILPADKVTFVYDSSLISLNISEQTVTSLVAGDHPIAAVAQDAFNSSEKRYTAILTVTDGPITEDFEQGATNQPRYFPVPASSIASDGSNRAYRLNNEISPLFGHEEWTHYSVEGKIKIVNRMLDASDTNTSFEIVMRRKALQGEYRGQAGHSFVYRIGSVSGDNYMRIGSAAGPKLDVEGPNWSLFKAEVNGNQLIFTLGNVKHYYALPTFTNGGFSFRANNSEIYLDDIVIRPQKANAANASPVIALTSDVSHLTVNKYDLVNMAERTAISAQYGDGSSKFVTAREGLSWSIVSGGDKAELLLGDKIRFRPVAEHSNTVTLRASYQGTSVDIVMTVFVPVGTEYDYIKSGTETRQESAWMKLAYNYGFGTLYEYTPVSYLQWVFGKMMLYPEEKNYDAEVQWMIDVAEKEELKGIAISGAEFVVNQMLVLYKNLDGRVNVSPNVWNDMIHYIQTFHYQQADVEISENHKIQHFSIALITGETWPSATMWNGQSGVNNVPVYKQYIKDWINRRLKVGMGEYDSKSYYGIDLAALSMLYTYTIDAEVKQMASDMLTYLYADLAVDSIEAKIGGGQGRAYANTIDVHNGLTQYANDILFDNSLNKVTEQYNSMNVQGAPVMISSYRPSEVLVNLVRDQTKRFNNIERKTIYQLPDDSSITQSLKKYTHVTPNYMLGSVIQEDKVPGLNSGYRTPSGTWVPQGHQDIPWMLTFGKSKDTVIFDSHPGPAGETDTSSKHAYFNGSYGCFCSKLFQQDNVLIGLHKITGSSQLPYTHFWLIKNQFDQIDEEDGWIFLRHLDVFAAIKPLKNGAVSASSAYEWTQSGKYADSEIKIHSTNTAFIVETVDSAEFSGNFDSFKSAIKGNTIAYSIGAPYYIEYTGLNGKLLRLEFDTDIRSVDNVPIDFTTYKMHDSPYLAADWNAGNIVLQHGGLSQTIELFP